MPVGMCLTQLLVGLLLLVDAARAFSPRLAESRPSTALWRVIRADEMDAPEVDPDSGGVGLANKCAIKITGHVKHKPGSANAFMEDLLRYDRLTEKSPSEVESTLSKVGAKIICKGAGKEDFVDPGTSTEAVIYFAPDEAIKEAFKFTASAIEYEQVVFNFLGGDDLMIMEVLEAAQKLTVMMDIATKAKVSFNSLCHRDFDLGSCTINVVGIPKSTKSDDEDTPVASTPLERGEVYFSNGKYYTAEEADRNLAEE